jgi:(p)ppGpp synthase/HD superfamily hydrolase
MSWPGRRSTSKKNPPVIAPGERPQSRIISMTILERAILLATQAHQGQKDKAGAPYILHPLRVMLQMSSETEMVTAVLHDVLEDTPWTLEKLREEGFPPEMLEALDCLTRRSGENYDAFITRVAGNQLARKVKLSDLEDNLNLRRLEMLTDQDQARLRRYHQAWLILATGE